MNWNVVLGIVTVVGTLFGAISIYDARKSKKELKKYTYLFDLAEKSIDKNLTMEEINRLHEEKKAMDKIIEEEIPRQARLTVMYDRLKADEEYLSSSYNRYKKTQNEYKKLQVEEKIEIPANILDEIENQILPEYLIKEKRQKYMSMLTTISYATAFLSIMPMFGVLGRYSVLLTAYPLARIIGLNMPKDKQERKKYWLSLMHNIILVILLLLNIYLGLLLYEMYNHHTMMYRSTDVETILSISGTIFVILLLPKIIIIVKKYKNKKRLK